MNNYTTRVVFNKLHVTFIFLCKTSLWQLYSKEFAFLDLCMDLLMAFHILQRKLLKLIETIYKSKISSN